MVWWSWYCPRSDMPSRAPGRASHADSLSIGGQAVPKSSSAIIGRRRVLQGAALVGAATLAPSVAAKSENTSTVMPVTHQVSVEELTADEIVTLLKLEPNATCGFVRVTFVSKHSIEA